MTSSRLDNKRNYVDILLHREDLATLVDLLSSTIDFYTKVAVTSLSNGDESSMQIFAARAKMMSSFNERFKTDLFIGEPLSRENH